MRVSQSNQFGGADTQAGVTQGKLASTGFGKQNKSNGFAVGTNPVEGKQVDPQGPTSFASIYNKRNMHATVNDSFARVGNTQVQAEAITRQRNMQM